MGATDPQGEDGYNGPAPAPAPRPTPTRLFLTAEEEARIRELAEEDVRSYPEQLTYMLRIQLRQELARRAR